MNTIANINAFLRVARLRSFSAAAREMQSVTSVVTKRISQLEDEVGTKLINRSTRGLALTAAGQRYVPHFLRLMATYDEVFNESSKKSCSIEGFVRIISAPAITTMFLGSLFTNFQLQNPQVDLEVVLTERAINPLEEGFDVAIGARPISFPNVNDVPLRRYDLVPVCAPSYLRGKNRPTHPTDLVDHQCLTTTLCGTAWPFTHMRGSTTVEVHSRMQCSDSQMVRDAARMGMGIAILPRMLVDEDVGAGTLVHLLEDFPVAPYWVKLMVPRIKMNRAPVRALVDFLRKSAPAPPRDSGEVIQNDATCADCAP